MASIFTEEGFGNTTPSSLGVFETLDSSTTSGVYWFAISLANLTDGEDLTVRVRLKVRSGGSFEPVTQETMSDSRGPETVEMFGPYSVGHEIEVAIEQLGGSLNAYEWSLMREVDSQDVAEPGDAMDLVTDAVDADALATDAINEIVAAIVASTALINAIADQVWEEQVGDHDGTAGSTAEALSNATSGVGTMAQDVWEFVLASVQDAGSASVIVQDTFALASKIRRMARVILEDSGREEEAE